VIVEAGRAHGCAKGGKPAANHHGRAEHAVYNMASPLVDLQVTRGRRDDRHRTGIREEYPDRRFTKDIQTIIVSK
jgi:hypothetical protein